MATVACRPMKRPGPRRSLSARPIPRSTGSLDAAALGRAMNRRMGPPGGGPGGPPDDGPGGPPGGPGGPGGFGPGTFLAPRILAAADANKDGRLSPEEAATAAEGFVRAADAKKKGSLDEDTLAGAINQRMGPPPGFGPGGPGGPMGQERKLLKQFDKNADNRLDRQERQAAREFLKKDRQGGRGRPGFGPPPGFGGDEEPKASPGPHIDPADVAAVTGKPLYDPTVVRTLFLEFEDEDWEVPDRRLLSLRRGTSGHVNRSTARNTRMWACTSAG